MFKILKKFVIYLLLLSHTFPQPIGTNDSSKETTLDVEQAVQKEIAPVLKKFENFVNIVDKDTKLLQKGEFLGELMSLGRKAVKADQLLEDQGGLKAQKERSDLYRVLLGIGHRVDTLEEILSAGSSIQLSGPRNARWINILKLQTPIVQVFRSRILKAGFTEELFAKVIQKICQERNDRARPGDVSLPEALKDKNVEEVLDKMKVPKDIYYKRAIQILLSPVEMSPIISN